MKKHIKFLCALLTCAACCGIQHTTEAVVEKRDVVVSMHVDSPTMKVNGIEESIDESGTSPLIVNGRTLVPIRAVAEAFDGIVLWNADENAVTLTMDNDIIKLVIDSNVAYLNNNSYLLDTAPTVIGGRTMLPVRFVAESFELGVAWEADTQTVTIVRNSFDSEEYNRLKTLVPAYSGSPYATINNGTPFFKDYEIIGGAFEYYSKLDELGRCDVCMASVAEDIMPTEKRSDISSVIPSGWHSVSYENISGKYLYNRCHLLGYQLTGENANEKNLITGTRYLNVDGMLPFENMLDDYIDKTGNHVMYRVTPVFDGGNLVADGVLLEAYSVEDNGDGIKFCVYCYNVQPSITIDYATGESRFDTSASAISENDVSENKKIYRTPSGKRYHLNAECGGKNSFEVTLDEALGAGLTPCAKCAK